jgi:hypothetical protein
MSAESPCDVEAVVSTTAKILAARGETRAVAFLVNGRPTVVEGDYDNWNGGTQYWTLVLDVSPGVYAQLDKSDRGAIQEAILKVAKDCFDGGHDYLTTVQIRPMVAADDAWRQKAKAWLAGDGVTNQGRVRSSNIAARTCDGLLFRSEPEIYLYKALKSAGVSFAPLPVFVRGGQDYRRIEPDFIIVSGGVMLHVEVDGDTSHQETPVEAHARTSMLGHEGVHLERVKAEACATEQGAKEVAARLLAILKKHAENK